MLVFFALTNLSLLNIVNVKKTLFANECADLYIGKSNRIAPELVSAIKSTSLFRHIVLIESPYAKKIQLFSNVPLLRFIPHLFEIVVDYHKIKEQLKLYSNNTKYDTVFLNKLNIPGTMLFEYFYKSNPNIKISYVEEGGGDMYMDAKMLYHQAFSWRILFSLLRILTHSKTTKAKRILISDKLYLYHPEIYSMDSNLELVKIPPLDLSDNVISKLLSQSLKNLDISEYNNKKFIYFINHNTMNNDYKYDYQHLDAVLSIINSNQLIIKEHPQAFIPVGSTNPLNKYEINNVFIDRRNYILESLYSCIDLRNKVLITRGSASALHPKYMYNNEPVVIFTYKLYPEDRIANEKLMGTDLQNCYTNKNKVYIPNTIDELKDIIISLN